MNAQQSAWLMGYLKRLKDCALPMRLYIMNDHRAGFQPALPVELKQRCLYEARLHQLNQKERECLMRYSEALWKSRFLQQSLPSFKYQNLIKADFTYHGVDIRSFLSDPSLGKHNRLLTASTIYRYRGKWYIYLCMKRL